MEVASDRSSPRPSGGPRPAKREFIVNAFLRHEGHLSADELVDLIRREDGRISRATVYRALQWMLDAGIARKIDGGDGRLRFEHAYRHPRHFHLICKTCGRSFEFLSSDIEALVEEIASARHFAARQSVVQIYGTCEGCRTGRPAPGEGVSSERLFARDALRIAMATKRSAVEFFVRAAVGASRRVKALFDRLAGDERRHLDALEARYRALLAADPQIEAHPTVLFFKGAANGLFAAGVDQVARFADGRQALLVAVRCVRGAHRFFERYGEQIQDAEVRQTFLEIAREEREHLDLLMRDERRLARQDRVEAAARGRGAVTGNRNAASGRGETR